MKPILTDRFWLRLIVNLNILILMSSGLLGQQLKASATQEQNRSDIAATLEEKIKIYNRDYCPPRLPITEISDLALMKLVAADLISRSELKDFSGMKLVAGKVVNNTNGAKSENRMIPGNNLVGELVATCEEMKNKKTRGKSEGNKKPEKAAKLKSRKVKYRDRDNQLREIEVFSPPKLKAKKKKKVKGKKGKKVKDYATSEIFKKNEDKDDSGKFKGKPSADSWVDND